MKSQVPNWQRGFAKSMRKDPTDAENAFWHAVRGHKFEGLKFKRQVPLGPYIADFVCHEAKLVVEVDGAQHQQSKTDIERDIYFKQNGYKTVRFQNDEVLKARDFVLRRILQEMEID